MTSIPESEKITFVVCGTQKEFHRLRNELNLGPTGIVWYLGPDSRFYGKNYTPKNARVIFGYTPPQVDMTHIYEELKRSGLMT